MREKDRKEVIKMKDQRTSQNQVKEGCCYSKTKENSTRKKQQIKNNSVSLVRLWNISDGRLVREL